MRLHAPRRSLTVLLGVLLAVSSTFLVAPSAHAATRTVDCRTLTGGGTFSNPLRVGSITQLTYVVNCPPLTSGSGFDRKYFLFDMPRLTANTYVMTQFSTVPNNARVNPALEWNAVIVKDALNSIYVQNGTVGGQAHFMNDLWAGYNWRLRAQKLSTTSTTTNWYNVIFSP